MTTKISRRTPLGSLPPDPFSPTVTGRHLGHDIEWQGPGWYGLGRYPGTEYYCWVRFTPDQRPEDGNIENAAIATAASMQLITPRYLDEP